MRILSGFQPSGTLHLGNYFGAMLPNLEFQKLGESYLFIADYHALTTNPDPEALRQRVFDVALDFLACGLDVEHTVFFRQSDVPCVTELMWILNTITTVGFLERAHSYKDKIAKGFMPNAGLFTYPVLMAADILLYQSDLVPVGKDQKQHLEITRDLAIRFNERYGEVFTIPDGHIAENVAVIPGLDGQKMSKSYNNTIPLFGAPKAIRKLIMSIVTDSKGLEDVKDPDTCNVAKLYKLLASEEQYADLCGNTVPATSATVTQNRLCLRLSKHISAPCVPNGKNLPKTPAKCGTSSTKVPKKPASRLKLQWKKSVKLSAYAEITAGVDWSDFLLKGRIYARIYSPLA